jgi:hypothetical protein
MSEGRSTSCRARGASASRSMNQGQEQPQSKRRNNGRRTSMACLSLRGKANHGGRQRYKADDVRCSCRPSSASSSISSILLSLPSSVRPPPVTQTPIQIFKMRYSILAFAAGAAAAPFAATGGAALCPTGLFSNPQCCATDVLGAVGLNCAVRMSSPLYFTNAYLPISSQIILTSSSVHHPRQHQRLHLHLRRHRPASQVLRHPRRRPGRPLPGRQPRCWWQPRPGACSHCYRHCHRWCPRPHWWC